MDQNVELDQMFSKLFVKEKQATCWARCLIHVHVIGGLLHGREGKFI